MNAIPAPRPRVSLCLIVKNEAANLPDCLASATGLVDDVVVVDTGSTDATPEIARRLGARVVSFPWVDDFAAARNESLRHATGNWAFWLDADDRIDAINQERVRRLFAGLPDDNVGYVMTCRCLPKTPTGSATLVEHVRLFRNDPRIRWEHRVHEQILPAIRRLGGTVEWTDVVIEHAGYVDAALQQRKLERNLCLLQLEEPERPNDAFTLFNLGTVHQELSRPAEGVPYLQRALMASQPGEPLRRAIYTKLALVLRECRRLPAALAVCHAGRSEFPGDLEILAEESEVHWERRDLPAAERCLRELLAQPDRGQFRSRIEGLGGVETRHKLAVICLETGRLPEAENEWRAVLRDEPRFRRAWLGLGEVLLRQDRRNELETVLLRLEEIEPGGEAARRLRARADQRRVSGTGGMA